MKLLLVENVLDAALQIHIEKWGTRNESGTRHHLLLFQIWSSFIHTQTSGTGIFAEKKHIVEEPMSE